MIHSGDSIQALGIIPGMAGIPDGAFLLDLDPDGVVHGMTRSGVIPVLPGAISMIPGMAIIHMDGDMDMDGTGGIATAMPITPAFMMVCTMEGIIIMTKTRYGAGKWFVADGTPGEVRWLTEPVTQADRGWHRDLLQEEVQMWWTIGIFHARKTNITAGPEPGRLRDPLRQVVLPDPILAG